MPMWTIYPVAGPADPRWQGRTIWDRVIVRAPTAAMARVLAAKLDRPRVPHRMGNETHCFRSGLEDERLYWVRRLSNEDAAACSTEPLASGRDGLVTAVRRGEPYRPEHGMEQRT